MNVLVVEDEVASLKLANLILTAEGHDVVDAESAEHAIKAVAQKQPDIILLDLGLPGMDGMAFARQLTQDPETKHIPIVAVTAYPDRFPREEALRAGCAAYIMKPIDTRKLPAQVKSIAERQNKARTK